MKISSKAAFLIMMILSLSLLTACGEKGQRGVIIGINAKVPIEELGGTIENLVYDGSVIVKLPDGEEVTASCPENFLSDVRGIPEFSQNQISGGFIASITINLSEDQEVLLVHNESDDWEVTKVLQ